jgi:hypothetical protein
VVSNVFFHFYGRLRRMVPPPVGLLRRPGLAEGGTASLECSPRGCRIVGWVVCLGVGARQELKIIR